MEQNKRFELDKEKLIQQFEDYQKLSPEDELAEDLLFMIKKSTPNNLDGGIGYFVVDTPCMNDKLNDEAISFEHRYKKPFLKR